MSGLEILPRHKYRLDGREIPSVTTLIDRGCPKPALIQWAAETSASYAVDHWQELSDAGVAERLRRIEKARFTERDRAAVKGQQVHELAWRLAHGERVDVPAQMAAPVDSYLRFVAEWEPRELLLEAAVVHRRWWYAGRLDFIGSLADGLTWLLDFKTGKGVYAEAALQLAAYRYAEAYIDADGLERPLPSVDRVGVVHLTGEGYELLPIDAGPEAFDAFLYVKQVAHFAEQGRDRWVDEPLAPPITEALA